MVRKIHGKSSDDSLLLEDFLGPLNNTKQNTLPFFSGATRSSGLAGHLSHGQTPPVPGTNGTERRINRDDLNLSQ